MPMNKIPKLREPRGPIVQKVRDIFMEREFRENSEDYYAEDVSSIENLDFLLQRCVIMQRKNVEASVKMVNQMLKWRKEKKLYDLSSAKFPRELALSGAAFVYGEDKFGNKTLYLRAALSKNCVELKNYMKDFLSYLMFLIDDSKDGKTYAIIMDLTDTTLGNYDFDLMSHFVSLLKDHFPVNLDYVLAINFPWILSATWSIIKRLIPSEKRDVVQFINSSKIFDFIDKENCPDFLGGTCTEPYRFDITEAPTTFEYLIQTSGKTVTKKRLNEILGLFYDILPKDHINYLRNQLDRILETKEGLKLEDLSNNNNDPNNNNNFEDITKPARQSPITRE